MWRGLGLAMAVVLTLPSCGTTSAGDVASAMPTADLAGWRRVLSDDFTGSSLSSRWAAYDGQPSGDPAGWFDPARVTVTEGILTIRGAYVKARGKWVTGGVSTKHTLKQVYGKYEVRFRADRGTGIAYALLLWPVDDSWPPEIDFAEDNGAGRDRLYSTLHAIGGSQIERSTTGDFTDWHVAGVEWTPGRLAYTLDGKVWATLLDDRVPDRPMALALQSQAWYCGHTWQKCPDSTTPETVDLQVDWVVAYARRSA
ncbi:glycoside hydrolase family 16 protein [Cryptosporangium aurantiacum]|uniref:Glycosyl hydrolases family 16 n=1 Tax=Cryptosporangium aurantiacum TaxID=134849 RepID=A0A1M7H837_9ACTN|nr:glycoside hydrolase family 16 protein [Cryptosporangium aurantiacum]SHM24529.1 Glycosyl hydrolases family 16 [Cryptosporangium aurantiacum]